MNLTNFAVVAELIAVAAAFALLGWATAYDNGRATLTLVIAVIAALALSAYALIAYSWPWPLCSLGVFAVVHLVTALRQGRAARPETQKTDG